jgi:hypothetical protein
MTDDDLGGGHDGCRAACRRVRHEAPPAGEVVAVIGARSAPHREA